MATALARTCVTCGGVKRIAAHGQCTKCYDHDRYQRNNAGRGPTIREYICEDCQSLCQTEARSGVTAKRCSSCTDAREAELRRVRDARSHSKPAVQERNRTRRAATKARHAADGLPDGEKPCAMCKQVKSFADFPLSLTKRDGRHSYCLPCYREQDRVRRNALRADYQAYSKKWQDANPLAVRLRKYPIKVDGYLDMLQTQHYACAICALKPDDPYSLLVDHDHVTGQVRGLLCTNCNPGLGRFRDNLVILRAAVAYLESAERGERQPEPAQVVPTHEHVQPFACEQGVLRRKRSPLCV